MITTALDRPGIREAARLFTVEEYHSLDIGERTELIKGVILHKMTKSPLHTDIINALWKFLFIRLPTDVEVRKEDPLTMSDSEPEPDLAITAVRNGPFGQAHPSTAFLAIEVSVTTLALDEEKAEIYAEAGIPEYWMIIPKEERVVIFSKPENGSYLERRNCSFDNILSLSKFNISFTMKEALTIQK